MATIEWRYDNDDISAHVELASARVVSRANGGVGEMSIRVRDLGHVFLPSYWVTGRKLQLFINGDRVWDGYLMGVGRDYAFDVDDTTQVMATPRWWRLKGVDRNILLVKRFVYRQNDPANADGVPDFDQGTMDREAIFHYRDYFVDLEGDDILFDDTGIEEIATPGPYEEFTLAGIGQPLGVIFEDCSKITGGVYYIDPDRVLRYRDDATVTAPFILSDNPTDEDEIGYREIEDNVESGEMANDALVWGAGRGSAQPVFGRYTDEDAVATYGRWQWGDQWVGANQDLTVERRARTYVLGSPSHSRGHNEEQPRVTLRFFNHHGFRAGQVAHVRHHVYNWSDSLPIRELTITFPTPSDVKYELMLTRNYDTPYGVIDDWSDPWTETITIGDPGGGRGGGSEGAVIDEFDREWHATDPGYGEGTAWGTATCGTAWVGGAGTLGGGTPDYVQDDLGWAHLDELSDDDQGHGHPFYLPITTPSETLWRLRFWPGPTGGHDLYGYDVTFYPMYPFSAGQRHLLYVHFGPFDIHDEPWFSNPPGNGLYVWYPMFGTEYSDFRMVRIRTDATGYKFRTWNEASPEPAAWAVEGTWSAWVAATPEGTGEVGPESFLVGFGHFQPDGGSSQAHLEIDWIREAATLVPGETPASGVDIYGYGWGGYTDRYQTRWPYAPGSLEISFQGISLRRNIDYFEIDPRNGVFRISPDIPGFDSVDNMVELVLRYDRVGTEPTVPQEIGDNVGGGGSGSTENANHPYRPAKQMQLGWGTPYDGTNCRATASAMCLERDSEGGYSPSNGSPRAIPPNVRYYSGNRSLSGGLTGRDCVQAWRVGWNRHLTFLGFISWGLFVSMIREGRGAEVAGIYGTLPERLRFTRTGFSGPHSVYVNEELPDGNFLVFDPLTRKSLVYTPQILYEYMQAFTGLRDRVSATFSRIT